MADPRPTHPCPWCCGRSFGVTSVFLEISGYGSRFNAVTCKGCGHTSFFTTDPPSSYHAHVEVPAATPPHR